MTRGTTIYLYELAWILPSVAIPVGMLVALVAGLLREWSRSAVFTVLDDVDRRLRGRRHSTVVKQPCRRGGRRRHCSNRRGRGQRVHRVA